MHATRPLRRPMLYLTSTPTSRIHLQSILDVAIFVVVYRCVCSVLGLVSNYTSTWDQLPLSQRPILRSLYCTRIKASVSGLSVVDNMSVNAHTFTETRLRSQFVESPY